MALFHLTTQAVWAAAQATGVVCEPTSGAPFVHLSSERQWLATANRFFRGRPDLLLLVIREAGLAAEVRWEPADGDTFPHLYGPLPTAAVVEAVPLRLAADGSISGVARDDR